MNSQQLNRRISIREQSTGEDAIGQPVDLWLEVVSVYANIRYLRGVEALRADSPASIASVSIRIRYRTDVTAAMRVHEGATVYHIEAVLPDEGQRQWVDLVCKVVS